MDTSIAVERADTLGRRVVRRRFRSLQDKRRVVTEAQAPGTSVAAVARAHGVNVNLIFAWIRLHDRIFFIVRSLSGLYSGNVLLRGSRSSRENERSGPIDHAPRNGRGMLIRLKGQQD